MTESSSKPEDQVTEGSAPDSASGHPAEPVGTAVPYTGDEHTEELAPEEIEVSAPTASKPPPTPSQRARSTASGELTSKSARLMLNDLFDSSPPPPGALSLTPSDPSAFTSSRPPPVAGKAAASEKASVSVSPARPSRPSFSVPRPAGASIRPASAPSHPAPKDVSGRPRADAQPIADEEPSSVVRLPSIPVGEMVDDGAPRAAEEHAEPAPQEEPEPPSVRGAEAEAKEPRPPSLRGSTEPEAEQVGGATPRSAPVDTPRQGLPRLEPSPAQDGADETLPLPSLTRSTPGDAEASLDPVDTPRKRAEPIISSTADTTQVPSVAGLGPRSGPAASTPRVPATPVPLIPPEEPAQASPAAQADASRGGSDRRHQDFVETVSSKRRQPVETLPSGDNQPPLPPASIPAPSPEAPTASSGTIEGGALSPGRSAGPAATVAAPAAVAAQAKTDLPSVMLADDLEQDVETERRERQERAARAAKQTVRLELPPGFADDPAGAIARMQIGGSQAQSPPQVPTAATAAPGNWVDRALWVLFGAILLTTATVIAVRMSGSDRGSLMIEVSGPEGASLTGLKILVGGEVACERSPCLVDGLEEGVHEVSAVAEGYAPQRGTVRVASSNQSGLELRLLEVAPTVEAGGIRIPATEQDLTLFVDRNRIGKLPQQVTGLSKGEHWIRLENSDGELVVEKAVDVVAGKVTPVIPEPEASDKALVTIELGRGSEGAAVTLDDAFLLDFPADLELDPSRVHVLSASKPGYRDFTMELELEAGAPRRVIEIDLRRGSARNRSKRRHSKRRRSSSRAKASKKPTGSAVASTGSLTLRSTPPSKVILNGKPIGNTPQVGVSVEGDTMHTILFVHPELGRRRAEKFVKAGEKHTVSIRF